MVSKKRQSKTSKGERKSSGKVKLSEQQKMLMGKGVLSSIKPAGARPRTNNR